MALGAGCAMTFFSFCLGQVTSRFGENLAEVVSAFPTIFENLPDTLVPLLLRLARRYLIQRSFNKDFCADPQPQTESSDARADSQAPFFRRSAPTWASAATPASECETKGCDAKPPTQEEIRVYRSAAMTSPSYPASTIERLRNGETVYLATGTRALLVPGTEEVMLTSITGANTRVSIRVFDPNAATVSPAATSAMEKIIQENASRVLVREQKTQVPTENVTPLAEDGKFSDLVRLIAEGKTVSVGTEAETIFLWPYPSNPALIYMSTGSGVEMILPIALFENLGQYQCECGQCDSGEKSTPPVVGTTSTPVGDIRGETQTTPQAESISLKRDSDPSAVRAEGEVEDADE